jgi:glycerophosphoryl diester phosphodiesterase
MDGVEIIAHRGSSLLAPENTRAAMELAWQEGADAIEGDFRLTRDGQIVCIHDASLKRTTGIDRRVAACTLEELRTYDAGSWKGPQFGGERIPTLEELLSIVPPGKRFYVEVKSGLEIVEPLHDIIGASSLPAEQIVLIGIQLAVVTAIKQAIPECRAYWVVEFRRAETGQWQPNVRDIIGTAKRAGLDGLDLMAAGPIDAPLVKRINTAGMELCVWTVDDPERARRLVDLGVRRITTNRPGWLKEQIKG